MEEHTIIDDFNQLIASRGYSIPQFLQELGTKRANDLLKMPEEELAFCKSKYELLCSTTSKTEKGRALEQLTGVLFKACCPGMFDIRQNIHTSSNEIDLLIDWTETARCEGYNTIFDCFQDGFICECKNYSGKVSVTYVGKFFSLLSVANCRLGIMISWNGVTGKSAWSDALGLIKKIALKQGIFIIVLDQTDLQSICCGHDTVFSIVNSKYQALKNDIDYSKYIEHHEAEAMINSGM